MRRGARLRPLRRLLRLAVIVRSVGLRLGDRNAFQERVFHERDDLTSTVVLADVKRARSGTLICEHTVWPTSALTSTSKRNAGRFGGAAAAEREIQEVGWGTECSAPPLPWTI